MSTGWRPLSGVRVVDLTRLLPGPFLSQILADLGADVVKVEEPGRGDYARWAPPELDGAGHWFSAVNRGKRSVAVNLKAPAGAEVVRRLAARADVFLEGFRPGVLDRLGLGDATLAALNPRLVRVGLVGYGEGPLREAPGHDLNYAGVAGILATQGTPEAPLAGAVPVGDLAGAMYGLAAALAGLQEVRRTGRGRRVEVALADAALAFHAVALTRAATGEPLPPRGAWELGGAMPGYRLYGCADGGWIALGALEPRFWDAFVEAVARPDLADLHLDASPAAHARLEALFRERDRDAWADLGARLGLPLTPVLDPREALDHPLWRHLAGRAGPGAPLTRRPHDAPVPALGAHTTEVLAELGYGPEDVARLRAEGAVDGA